MGIRTSANKYGGLNKDRVRDDQSASVGSPNRPINTKVSLQGMKQDSVTAGSFSKHLPKGHPISTSEGKLVATSNYGKAGKQA